MKHLIATLSLFALLSTAVATAGGEGWSSDFAASSKKAAAEKKDLLIDFTGSDWCGWCIKLNKEVFSHDAFKDGVKEKFVLVELDYPRDKSKLTAGTIKQNEELGAKYQVKGFPTILLCDAEGRPFASTGYAAGGPEKYVAGLDELRKKKTTRDESFAAASTATGVEKAKALVSALTAMSLPNEMVANFYGDILSQIKEADPEDETGFVKAAEAMARMVALHGEINRLGAKKDHDGALALVDKALKEGGLGPQETQQIMMTRCAIYAEQGKIDEAIKAAEETKAAAPESPLNGRIDAFIKQLEADRKKDADRPAPEAVPE